MAAKDCYTENPEFILKKEYTEKPDIEQLHEVFIVIYKKELPKWQVKEDELKESSRFIFFTKLEKAYKRFKMFGPNYAMLQRIFTDDEELYKLATQNDNIVVEDIEDSSDEEAPTGANEPDNGSLKENKNIEV
jgi:hypothetical protein